MTMKAADIQTGVLLAEQTRPHTAPAAVVVLAVPGPSQLYTGRPWGSTRPLYFRRASERVTRPRRSEGLHGKEVGYPAARLGHYAKSEGDEGFLTREQRRGMLTTLTLEDFLDATSPTDAEHGIEFFVLVSLRTIAGTYADVLKAFNDREAQAEADRAYREQVFRERAVEAAGIEARFRAHGIEGVTASGSQVLPSRQALRDILERLDALGAVAKSLAELDAPLHDGTYANGHDWCALCGGEGPRPEDHDKDCAWRLARELVS